MFLAVSRFKVADDMAAEVKAAFRPHLVDHTTGFQRMDVVSPLDEPDEIWLLTYWDTEASFQAWYRSHKFKESHTGIPKGTRLVPKSTELRFFEHICD